VFANASRSCLQNLEQGGNAVATGRPRVLHVSPYFYPATRLGGPIPVRKRLPDERRGVWVDNTPTALAEALVAMRGMPLREMGLAGRAWMQREYAWPVIARQTAALYQSL
jgi:glycosyltransferase involved in cell wall biosynthesis